jgi:hypothetical protein
MRKFVGVVVVGLAAMSGLGVALADSSAEELPRNWHVHDGRFALGWQHKGISFFPRILGISEDAYLKDPAVARTQPTRRSPQRSGEQQRCAARRRLRDEHDGHPPTNRPNGYSRTRGLAVAHHAERARLRHLLHGHAEAASASSGALSPYLSAICCSDRIGNFVHGLAPNGGPSNPTVGPPRSCLTMRQRLKFARCLHRRPGHISLRFEPDASPLTQGPGRVGTPVLRTMLSA